MGSEQFEWVLLRVKTTGTSVSAADTTQDQTKISFSF